MLTRLPQQNRTGCGWGYAVLAPNSKLMLSSAALPQIGLQNPVADTARSAVLPPRPEGWARTDFISSSTFPSLIISVLSNSSRGFLQHPERARASLPALIARVKLLLRGFQRGKDESSRTWEGLQAALQGFQSVLNHRLAIKPGGIQKIPLTFPEKMLYLRKLL